MERNVFSDRIKKHRSVLPALLVMYAVFCVYSIARSMGTRGQITFMGQPANYNSVLYPLLISPLYWLPQGTNYYRIIELINVLIYGLALFPIFFLAGRVCGSDKRAFVIAFISMLAPDFILGQLVFYDLDCLILGRCAKQAQKIVKTAELRNISRILSG